MERDENKGVINHNIHDTFPVAFLFTRVWLSDGNITSHSRVEEALVTHWLRGFPFPGIEPSGFADPFKYRSSDTEIIRNQPNVRILYVDCRLHTHFRSKRYVPNFDF